MVGGVVEAPLAGDTGVEVEVVGRAAAAASGGDLGIVGVFRPNPVAVVAQVAPGRQKKAEGKLQSIFSIQILALHRYGCEWTVAMELTLSSQHPENTCYLPETERT